MKKFQQQAGQIMITGVGLGLGASILSEAGSTQGAAAMSNMSRALPFAGSVLAADYAINAVKNLQKKR